MTDRVSRDPNRGAPSIWWWAFGYFASYVPYAAMAKAVTSGMVDTGATTPSGIELLAPSLMATVVTAFAFLIFTGWWRYAGRKRIFGVDVPCPSGITLASGLCASGIIATTTLAYTFKGTSIVLVQLLLRGGVLIIAPIIDTISRRKVRWYSWLGFWLSLAGLLVPFIVEWDFLISPWCALDVGLYVFCYFVRLQLMTRRAKSEDPNANMRYFVEEQLVSSPALLIGLLIGITSQGTGIFGGLILLDKRENTFCVPVNRASSILAGLIATLALVVLLGGRMPAWPELVGAALMVCAIGALTVPPALEKRRLRLARAAAPA